MKILITGGAGYVGGALTDILLKTNHEIRVYDSLIYQEDYLKNVPFVLGDIRDRQLLKKQLKWADAVVWLAALVGDGACALDEKAAIETNQESVKWLSENFNGRIILTSTCSVYGMHEGTLTETSPVGPLSVYGRTKLAAEDYLKEKNAMIFRFGTLFGIGDRYSRIRLDLVVNTLTARAVTDHKLEIFGKSQYRPLLHVRDAAQAIADNLTSKHRGVFNLHKENIKILDLAKKVAKEVPGTKIKYVDMKASDMRNYRVTSIKAKNAFGFKPKLRIKDGIAEIKKLFEESRIKNLKNSRYTNEAYLIISNGAKSMGKEPRIIDGGLSVDDRGELTFFNGFDFTGVKRFYSVRNHKQGFIRAWHAHKREAKYVYLAKGACVIGVVQIKNWQKPNKKAKVERFVLSAKAPRILFVPPGYAHGFMTLTEDTQLIFFSTSTLKESLNDDFRYPAHYWDPWKVEER